MNFGFRYSRRRSSTRRFKYPRRTYGTASSDRPKPDDSRSDEVGHLRRTRIQLHMDASSIPLLLITTMQSQLNPKCPLPLVVIRSYHFLSMLAPKIASTFACPRLIEFKAAVRSHPNSFSSVFLGFRTHGHYLRSRRTIQPSAFFRT